MTCAGAARLVRARARPLPRRRLPAVASMQRYSCRVGWLRDWLSTRALCRGVFAPLRAHHREPVRAVGGQRRLCLQALCVRRLGSQQLGREPACLRQLDHVLGARRRHRVGGAGYCGLVAGDLSEPLLHVAGSPVVVVGEAPRIRQVVLPGLHTVAACLGCACAIRDRLQEVQVLRLADAQHSTLEFLLERGSYATKQPEHSVQHSAQHRSRPIAGSATPCNAIAHADLYRSFTSEGS